MDELLSGIKKEEKKHAICDNMDLEAIMLSEISQTGKENRIVVLEKTLESPLDCKEIKPDNPKGSQP